MILFVDTLNRAADPLPRCKVVVRRLSTQVIGHPMPRFDYWWCLDFDDSRYPLAPVQGNYCSNLARVVRKKYVDLVAMKFGNHYLPEGTRLKDRDPRYQINGTVTGRVWGLKPSFTIVDDPLGPNAPRTEVHRHFGKIRHASNYDMKAEGKLLAAAFPKNDLKKGDRVKIRSITGETLFGTVDKVAPDVHPSYADVVVDDATYPRTFGIKRLEKI